MRTHEIEKKKRDVDHENLCLKVSELVAMQLFLSERVEDLSGTRNDKISTLSLLDICI